MKACVFEKSHNSSTFVLRDVEVPVPKEGEVLIRVISTGLNAADYRSARMGIIPRSRIFGADVAGIIESVGAGSAKWRVGDAVVGDLSDVGFGGLAEFVSVPEKSLSRKPETIDFDTAAALPLAGVTALQGVRDSGRLQRGQRVLICGAGGGVGTYAVQLCRYFGADVTAICGPGNIERVKALGAGSVFDYMEIDLRDLPSSFDLVLLINGGYSYRMIRNRMKAGGICVTIGGPLSHVMRMMFLAPLFSIGSKKFRVLAAKTSSDDLAFLLGLVEKKVIVPVVDSKFSLEKAPDAFQYLTQGHSRGKVVVHVATDSSSLNP